MFWENLKKIILWFTSPLDNHSKGSSARKWSALIAIIISIRLSLSYTTETTLATILSIWLIFALMCLAIVTGAQLVMLKNGTPNEPSDIPPDENNIV